MKRRLFPVVDPKDLPIVYVCQAKGCFRMSQPTWITRRYWLIADRIDNPDFLVIRCPHHITETALRKTRYRRTNIIMQWKREANRLKLPPVSQLDPFPYRFLGADRSSGLKDDVPNLEEFFDRLESDREHRKFRRGKKQKTASV